MKSSEVFARVVLNSKRLANLCSEWQYTITYCSLDIIVVVDHQVQSRAAEDREGIKRRAGQYVHVDLYLYIT
jgi:hypothetical protein